MNNDRENNQARKLPASKDGARITRQEIMDVLADEGYSAGERKGWLKKVLTVLISENEAESDPKRANLIAEVKQILDDQFAENGLHPKSDDVL